VQCTEERESKASKQESERQGGARHVGKVVQGNKARQCKVTRQGSARHLGKAVQGN
jgi:hypothetical protein